MKRLRLLPLLLGLAALAPLLAGCDTAGPSPDPDDGGLRVAEVVLTTVEGDVVAYSHDDHWHGTVRARVGQTIALRAYVVSADAPDAGHDIPDRQFWTAIDDLPAEYSLRVTSDDETVARWTADRGALALASDRVGAALTTVTVLRGTTTRYQSPPAATIAAMPPAARTAAPAALAAR